MLFPRSLILCGILLILPQQDRQTQIAFTYAWRQPHKTWPAHQRLQLPGLGVDELQDLSQTLGGTITMNSLSSEALLDALKFSLTVDAQKQLSLGD